MQFFEDKSENKDVWRFPSLEDIRLGKTTIASDPYDFQLDHKECTEAAHAFEASISKLRLDTGIIALIGNPDLPATILETWSEAREHVQLISPTEAGHALKAHQEPSIEILWPQLDTEKNLNYLVHGLVPDKGFVVIPSLKKMFLRHAEGLDGVRSFFDKASQRGNVLVGMNRWSYRFLERAISVSSFCTQVLQAVPPQHILCSSEQSSEERDNFFPRNQEDSRSLAIVLYDLLLHENLREKHLIEISPLSSVETREIVAMLLKSQTVVRENGNLVFAPGALGFVVQYLGKRGWIQSEEN